MLDTALRFSFEKTPYGLFRLATSTDSRFDFDFKNLVWVCWSLKNIRENNFLFIYSILFLIRIFYDFKCSESITHRLNLKNLITSSSYPLTILDISVSEAIKVFWSYINKLVYACNNIILSNRQIKFYTNLLQ